MKNIIDENEMSLATLTDESEHVEAELMPIAQYEEISLVQQEQAKKSINNLKQRMMLVLDQKKLVEAQKIIGSIENLSDLMLDPEVLSRVKENTKSAMDLKFLAESYSKLIDAQQKLMRLDTADGNGTAAIINVGVEYSGKANGTKVQTYIKIQE